MKRVGGGRMARVVFVAALVVAGLVSASAAQAAEIADDPTDATCNLSWWSTYPTSALDTTAVSARCNVSDATMNGPAARMVKVWFQVYDTRLTCSGGWKWSSMTLARNGGLGTWEASTLRVSGSTPASHCNVTYDIYGFQSPRCQAWDGVAPEPDPNDPSSSIDTCAIESVVNQAGPPDYFPQAYYAGGLPGLVVTRPAAELFGTRASAGYAGDPVNTATGNFTDTHVDVDFPVTGLDLSRTYNSGNAAGGVLGRGWSSGFGATVVEDVVTGDVTFTDVDGRIVTFAWSGSSYTRPEEVFADLVKNADGAFTLDYDDGHALDFDAAGKLARWRGWDGQEVAFTYTGGVLTAADHNAGYGLDFAYLSGLLTRVDASDGRSVVYGYTAGRLTSVTDPAGGVTTYDYDSGGRLKKITDPDGVVVVDNVYDTTGRVVVQATPTGDSISFAYDVSRGETNVHHAGTDATTVYGHDAMGRVISITDADGQVLSKSYDGAGNLVAMVDRRGAAVSQTFNGHGLLLTRSGPGGVVEVFTYDSAERMVTTTNGEGETTTFTYDGVERVPSTVVDGAGAATSLDVGADGLVRSVTDADGVTVAFGYDGRRNLTSVIDEANRTTSFAHDGAGNRTSVTTPLGRVTSWAFDGLRRELTATDPSGGVVTNAWTDAGRLESRTDQEGKTTSLGYDTAGRLSSVIDPLGNVTSYGYDMDGNLTSIVRPGGSVWSAVYDALGRRASETDPTGVTVSYGFDADGNPTTSTDEDGGVVTRTFDLRGRVTSVSDELAHLTGFAYDRADRLVSVTDALGNVTAFAYDDAGRLVSTTRPGDGVKTTAYTAAGRIASETDANGHATAYAYDGVGRLSSVTDPLGGVARFGYDDDGRLASTTSPAGLVTTFAFDDAARSVTVDPPGVGPTVRTFTARGLLAAVDEPATNPVSFAYDAAGRLSSAADPLGRVTAFGYDGRGNLTSRTNANGGVDHWTYDLADRPLSHTDPIGQAWTRGYDTLGRVRTVADPSGRSVTIGYDPAHRPVTESWATGATITTTYDPLGRVTGKTDGVETSAWAWDAVGNMVSSTTAGCTLAYGYDAAGNRTSLTYPDGTTAAFAYDPNDRLASVSHPQAGTSSYVYDEDGRLVAESLAAGVVARGYSYDEGQLVGYRETWGAARTTALERDDAGRIVREATAGVVATYAYDPAGQLVETNRAGARTTITYDMLGNRDLVTRGNVVDDYTHDPAGRLTTIRRSIGGLLNTTTRLDHDAAGRLTDRYDNTGSQLYGYDQRGLLASTATHTPTLSTFTERHHDAGGQLTATDTTDTTGTFRHTGLAWDQSQPVPQVAAIATAGGDTNLLYGQGRIAAIRNGHADPFAHDHYGSTLALGSAADLAAGASYDPFGAPTPATTALGDIAFGYRGELVIDGLVHLRNRDYTPTLGRFTTVDPLEGVPGTTTVANPYHYANNDPLNQIDPLGLRPLNDSDMRLISNTRGRWEFPSWDQAKGVWGGMYDSGFGIIAGTRHLITNPTQLWRVPGGAYRDFGGGWEGTLAAINQFNPIYHGLNSAQACMDAVSADDAYGVGYGCTNLILDAAAAAAIAEGTAAGLSRRLGAAGGPANEASVRLKLAPLAGGRSTGVRAVSSAAELDDLFVDLTRGGQAVSNSYPGKYVRLPDGTEVGLRQTSQSGGPTIDVRLPSGERIKVHVEP